MVTCACGAQWERPIEKCPLCEKGMDGSHVTFIPLLSNEEIKARWEARAKPRRE